MTTYPVTQTDAMTATDGPSLGWGTVAVDTFHLPAIWSWKYLAGAALVETVNLGEIPSTAAIARALLVDRLGLAAALTNALHGLIFETLQLDDLQLLVQATRVIDSLGLHDLFVSNARLLQALVEDLSLNDRALWFFGGFLSETIGVGSTATRLYQAGGQVGEDFVLADLLSRKFITRLDHWDRFEIIDAEVLQGIYNGTLCDKVRITCGMVLPSGSFTTWAINTRTNAVTEYKNYAFNSFAQMGHRFLGATNDGLYILDGPMDDGEAIRARMRSGIMQLTGTKFTMFKGAYLGLRTQDDGRNFILKLIYGDGPNVKETIYRVVAQNLKTSKVNLGKGIRARYISWELETVGQDFDLDGIEFVPISAQRRV